MTKKKRRRHGRRRDKSQANVWTARYRHKRQVMDRPIAVSKRMMDVAACVFMPQQNRMHFDTPFCQFGDVTLAVLSRFIHRAKGNALVSYLRGFQAELDPDNAHALWGPVRSVFAYDLSQPVLGKQIRHAVPTYGCPLAETALDMDMDTEMATKRSFRLPGSPAFPPTMLAVAPGTTLEPCETPEVRREMSRGNGYSLQEAWNRLAKKWHIPAGDGLGFYQNNTGYDLVDTRLYNQVRPHTLAPFHDMRGFLGDSGRRLPNVARRWLAPPNANNWSVVCDNPTDKVLTQHKLKHDDLRLIGDKIDAVMSDMRKHLGPEHVCFSDEDISHALGEPRKDARGTLPLENVSPELVLHSRTRLKQAWRTGVTDRDLEEAWARPAQQLVASKLSSVQVWRLGQWATAEMFQITDKANMFEADLWHVQDNMMSFVQSAPQERQHEKVGSAG